MNKHQPTPSAPTASLPDLLTSKEVMTILRIKTKNTLCRWVRMGKLEAIRRPDHSYVFEESVILAWLENRKTSK
jgi:predicted site-specific integrase-resolvase